MRESARPKSRTAQPLRTFAQRFTFLILLGGAAGLLLLGKTDPLAFERARDYTADVSGPVLNFLSRPVAAIDGIVSHVGSLIDLRAENHRLKAENAALLEWQAVARQLGRENDRLRELMAYERQDVKRFVTGRVIGVGGSFVRTLLLNVGSDAGVRKGQAAVSGKGLVGRISTVGRRTARLLLITDLNSRIPVMIEDTGHRAILAGDNTRRPHLIFLSADARPTTGQRVVTSGHGGVFPPGVPVGTVDTVGEGGVSIIPGINPDALEYVRLMDFGLGGILPDDAGQSAALR